MTLQEFKIIENIETLTELAKRLKVSDHSNPSRLVQRWINGTSFPNQKHLLIIYSATNGKVTPTDFLTR